MKIKKPTKFAKASVVLTMFLLITSIMFTGLASTIINQHHAYAEAFAISDINSHSTDPVFASDSQGNVFVAWYENNEVMLKRVADAGTNPDPDENNISNTPDMQSRNPQLTIDPLDNVYVVWQESFDDSESSSDIMLSKISFNEAVGTLHVDSPINISNTADTPSTNPQIAADSSGNIYAVWHESQDIMFTRISYDDEGNAIVDLSTNISNTPDTDSDMPSIGLPSSGGSSSIISVVWQEQDSADASAPHDIFYKKITADSGENNTIAIDFTNDFVPISNTPDQESILPTIGVSGDNVVIAWQEFDIAANPDFPTYEVYYTSSPDNGDSFYAGTFVINDLSNTPGVDSITPSVGRSSSGDLLFIIWEENNFSGFGDIYTASSLDSGETFGCATNVATGLNEPILANPQITLFDVGADNTNSGAYAAWADLNPDTGVDNIIFNNNIDYQAQLLSIFLTGGTDQPRWGTEEDQVIVSGGAINAAPGDIVSVNWGDGSSSNSTISGCSWDQVSHVYGPESAGLSIEITATLVDGSSGEPKVSSTGSVPILVQSNQHSSSLVLNPIPSVKAGSPVTVTGSLTDSDSNTAIENAMITFDGTGTEGDAGLATITATTFPNGTFSATATSSADIPASGLTVQAHYSGNLAFFPSDSNIQSYNTVDPAALSFDVGSGTDVLVNLDGFDTSVTFDQVLAPPGAIFVSSDPTPSNNSRFLAFNDGGGIFLTISPGLLMAPDTFAHIEMSIADKNLHGYSIDDFDIFLETSPGVYQDITESKDPVNQKVTGITNQFGKFIGAIALHGDAEQENNNVIRKHVYIGDETQIFIRNPFNTANVTAPVISLDKNAYNLTDVATLSIFDKEANSDPESINHITAFIKSNTSAPSGITIDLFETESDSSMFTGTFTFTNVTASSGSILQVVPSDKLTVSYEQILGARARVIIDGVTEAGVVDVSDFRPSLGSISSFNPSGYAVEVSFVDSDVLPNGNSFNITLSYANIPLGGSEESVAKYLRMYQGERAGPAINWFPFPITPIDSDTGLTVGVNTTAKTVTAKTSLPGIFILGLEVGSPGGSGGGLGLPGTGVVLDFVASIAQTPSSRQGEGDGDTSPPSGHGGGGGGGGTGGAIVDTPSPPEGSSSVSPGTPAEVTVSVVVPDEKDTGSDSSSSSSGESSSNTGGGSNNDNTSGGSSPTGGGGSSFNVGVREVTLLFQNVTSGGSVHVVAESLDQIASLFDRSIGLHGYLIGLNQANYTTVGHIYDIQPSSQLAFNGIVDVTIPYDEYLISTANSELQAASTTNGTGSNSSSSSSFSTFSLMTEEDVRLLHYNGSAWEDITIGVNTTSNTITGRLESGSMSPVVAAVISDGTYGDSYFEVNQLGKIGIKNQAVVDILNSMPLTNATEGEQVAISAILKNAQRIPQSYAYIVEVFTPEGYADSLSFGIGELQRGEVTSIASSWTPTESGVYSVKIFVLNSLTDPIPLSNVTSMNLNVLGAAGSTLPTSRLDQENGK